MENKNISNFIKFAYEQGKIKEVEEAFKEYPVEEEWHKGSIDNILNENKSEYKKCFYNKKS